MFVRKSPGFRSARSATLRPGACHHLPCFSSSLQPRHTMLEEAVVKIKTSLSAEARSSAGLRPAVSLKHYKADSPGVGWSWVAPEVCRLPHSAALWKQHDSHRNVSWSSSRYSRVYNPWKSPWNASDNWLRAAAFIHRWLLSNFLPSRLLKNPLLQCLFDLFCFVLFWLEAKTPFWRLFTTVRRRVLRMRQVDFWETESFVWQHRRKQQLREATCTCNRALCNSLWKCAKSQTCLGHLRYYYRQTQHRYERETTSNTEQYV